MLKFNFKLLIMLIPVVLFSQTFEPEPFYFYNWDSSDSTITAPLNKSVFKQNKIMKGFQWHGNYGLNKALNMNTFVSGIVYYNTQDNCDPDTNAQNYTEPINEIKQATVCQNMVGMQYEPTLELTEDEFNNFKTRDGDSSNPVFGFENIEGEISTNSLDSNYSRLILRDTILNNNNPKNVLKGIVPNPKFWSEYGEYQLQGYSGEIWWLSLNLNRLDSNSDDYNLLRISELGSNVDSLNSLWHRDTKYYDLVTDTVIGQDKPLSFKLLPGQGKIFKVEVLKPDIVEGFLDNNNQNNLIEYRDILDTNMIVYHLAFYKNSKRPNDTSKVYKEVHYIRSYPIARHSLPKRCIP